MKRDYVITSIVTLTVITLISVFAKDYMYGMNVPLLIIGLGFMLFAVLKRIRDRKKHLKEKK